MEPSIRGPVTSALTRKSRGPRTRLGKERSKHNALTHGIFAKVVVLESEPQAEFDSQLNGLRKDFQDGGLVRKIRIPGVLEKCLDLLGTLKLRIETNGFDSEKDKDILTKLYGVFDKDQSGNSLFTTYSTWPTIADTHGQLPSAEECKSRFLEELAKEMKTLVRCQEEQRAIESKQMKLESLRRVVPDSPRLDQLIKYLTTLERTFDRTLSQLERAQRMRLGQPVTPRIDVNFSSS